MSRLKRLLIILALPVVFMLIVPLIAVNTVKADSGMLAVLFLFFAVYPILSVILGIISGKDIKFFWFVPILIGLLFWVFSSFTFRTAFPVVYSLSYLIISAVAMGITNLYKNRTK